MSNTQLDDLNEQQGNKAIAKALGISEDELDELDYGDIETNESNDGLVYSCYIEVQKDSSSQEILEQVMKTTEYDDNHEYITVYLELENYPPDNQEDKDDEPQSDGSSNESKGGHRLF